MERDLNVELINPKCLAFPFSSTSDPRHLELAPRRRLKHPLEDEVAHLRNDPQKSYIFLLGFSQFFRFTTQRNILSLYS